MVVVFRDVLHGRRSGFQWMRFVRALPELFPRRVQEILRIVLAPNTHTHTHTHTAFTRKYLQKLGILVNQRILLVVDHRVFENGQDVLFKGIQ